jgi:hypothetical protein
VRYKGAVILVHTRAADAAVHIIILLGEPTVYDIGPGNVTTTSIVQIFPDALTTRESYTVPILPGAVLKCAIALL